MEKMLKNFIEKSDNYPANHKNVKIISYDRETNPGLIDIDYAYPRSNEEGGGCYYTKTTLDVWEVLAWVYNEIK